MSYLGTFLYSGKLLLPYREWKFVHVLDILTFTFAPECSDVFGACMKACGLIGKPFTVGKLNGEYPPGNKRPINEELLPGKKPRPGGTGCEMNAG